MPDEAFLNGYEDDIIAVVTARSLEHVQMLLNRVMIRVKRLMAEHGLEIAEAKTEIFILSKKRIPKEVLLTIGDAEITTKLLVKYLGIHLDTKLNYWTHLANRAVQASTVTMN